MRTPEHPTTWLSRLVGWLTRRETQLPDGNGDVRVKSRPIMDRVLKEVFAPELKARGFTGSFPHFRRGRSDRIDLVSFQYARRGGQFMVNLAQCGPEGVKTEWGQEIPPGKVTAHDVFPRQRLRFKWGWRGQLFVFDRPYYDPPAATSEAAVEAACARAAAAALKAFNEQAEPWWEKKAAAKQTAGG